MTKKQITFLADEATVAELDYLTRLSTTTRSELIRTLISKEYKLDNTNLEMQEEISWNFDQNE